MNQTMQVYKSLFQIHDCTFKPYRVVIGNVDTTNVVTITNDEE